MHHFKNILTFLLLLPIRTVGWLILTLYVLPAQVMNGKTNLGNRGLIPIFSMAYALSLLGLLGGAMLVLETYFTTWSFATALRENSLVVLIFFLLPVFGVCTALEALRLTVKDG